MVLYSIHFSFNARDEYRKLPLEIQERIKKKLLLAQANPYTYFERLKSRPDYKLRIGDYRLIADINQASFTVAVTKVGHRKNIYQNL